MKKLLLFLMLIPSLVCSQNASELMAKWGVTFNWFSSWDYDQDIDYYNNAAGAITAGQVTGNNVNFMISTAGFTGSNWGSSQTSPDYTKYFQFTVIPATGKNLTPKFFRLQQTGVCRKFQVRYSTSPSFPNNGTLLLQVDNANNVQDSYINVPFPANVSITSGQTLYIRVYGYYRSSNSSWSIKHDGLVSGDAPEFYGTITNTITANADTATTYQGQPVNINVTSNDAVVTTTISNISIASQSPSGVAVVQPNKTITFTPNSGYFGTTSFQYMATAANGGTSTATVTVNVLPIIAPIAVADVAAVMKNTTKQINVLNNDVPGTGTITTVSVTGAPSHGSVTVQGNSINYTPAVNYIGPDTFTYTITDTFNNTAVATVIITVSEPVLPASGSNAGIYCSSSTTWNGTQWSNGLPSSSKDVIFTGNYTKSGGTLHACSIFVTGTAQVIFENNSNAVVTHSVNVEETASLTFESSCNLIQIQNTPNEGNVTVKRKGSKLKRLDYTFWSSPVTGEQTLLEFSPATLPNRFYTYNTQNGNYIAEASPATTPFTTARSYLIRMPDAITGPQAQAYAAGAYRFTFEGIFTGVPNNGTITIPIEYYSEGSRFNGVGNPYPSPISVTDFIDANIANIEGTIWIWRKTNNPLQTSYCTLTKFGYVGNNAPGGGGAGGNDGNDLIADPFSINLEGVLNAGQGFIIKAKNNANLVFTNSMRRQVNYSNFFRFNDSEETFDDSGQTPPTASTTEISRFWLNLSNEAQDIFSQTLIGYTPEATLDYDNGLDGHFVSGGAANVYSLSNDVKLIIQARPQFGENDIVQLGFKAQSAGQYIFSLDRTDGIFLVEQPIYLHDKLLDVLHDLQDGEYVFDSEAGTFEDRFEIVYTPEALAAMPVQEIAERDVIVYSDLGKVGVKSGTEVREITIYNLQGKKMYSETGINNEYYLTPFINITGQAVVIKLRLQDGDYCYRKLLMP